jgi:hypothetical protein
VAIVRSGAVSPHNELGERAHLLEEVPVVVRSSALGEAPAGVALVLKKPVQPERLLSIVREYCAR